MNEIKFITFVREVKKRVLQKHPETRSTLAERDSIEAVLKKTNAGEEVCYAAREVDDVFKRLIGKYPTPDFSNHLIEMMRVVAKAII